MTAASIAVRDVDRDAADIRLAVDDAGAQRFVIDDDTAGYLRVLGLEHRCRPLDPWADPITSYMGSKDAAGNVERIIGHFPEHSVYVEPFLGGGAVLRRKKPALASIGIDADAEVIDRWRATGFPAQFIHGDAIAWLDEYGRGRWNHRYALPADALVYIDPPYMPETRTSHHKYRCELSEADHARLLEVLRLLPCNVVISGYDSPLYREALCDWKHDSFTSMTRGGLREEHLWIKRSASSLATYAEAARFAGSNFRERERIKRKAARWRENWRRLPAPERDAVLRALIVGNDDLRAPPPEPTMFDRGSDA